MRDRFDKFSDRARAVMTRAHEEARALDHQHIDSGHLLLAIVWLDNGLAGDLLRGRGVTTERVRGAIEAQAGQTDAGSRTRPGVGMTDDGRQAIEVAVSVIRRSGLRGIDAEHLLLGVLKQSASPAAAILQTIGVSQTDLTAELEERLLADDPPGPNAATAEEALDLARRDLDRRGRTPLIANLEARILVIERLAEARDAFGRAEVSGYPKLIGEELVRPDLEALIGSIEEGARTLPEFLERVGEVRHARAMLERLATVFQRADQHQLADSVSKAAAALQVVNPLF